MMTKPMRLGKGCGKVDDFVQRQLDALVERLRASQNVHLFDAAARIAALEARVAAADKLAEAVTHEREMVCQDFGMQQDAATAVHNALAAYEATKEQSDG